MRTHFSTVFLLASMPLAAQWLNYPTPGIPRLPDGSPNLTAKAPKLADGIPDLSGIWSAPCGIYDGSRCFVQSYYFDLAKDLPAGSVRMTPWAEEVAAQRTRRNHIDDPYGYCLPPGVPRIDFGGGPYKIVQSPGLTAILYETLVGMIFRQVFTDGRPPAPADAPTWLGYSTGHWEADTFVIDSRGFRDGGWIDTAKGRPSSDALQVIERFRRIDFGHMALSVTIDDPKAYLKPWTMETTLTLMPDTELMEAFCDNQDRILLHTQIKPEPEPPSPPLQKPPR
ncbi:MAG: hypothetical protein ABI811_21530 [Acidobacteriota bacterium]